MQRRLTIVTRKALGDRMSTSDARCQRMKASWTASSASATLPSMRYAIENRRPRCCSNAASLVEPSASGGAPGGLLGVAAHVVLTLICSSRASRQLACTAVDHLFDAILTVLASTELVEVRVRRGQCSEE